MNTTVAIYSHSTRTKARDATVADLRNIGIEPDVITIQDAPPNQIANRHNAYRALGKAYDGAPVLMLEDDVIPNDHLVEWIEWLELHAPGVVTLYAPVGKFYTPDLRSFVEHSVIPRVGMHGLAPLLGLRGWYGAQAVWIPTITAERMLSDKLFTIFEHAPYGPWDHAIRMHLQTHQEDMHITIPNIVQHRAPPSVVNRTGPRHTTPIFDRAARPPEWSK